MPPARKRSKIAEDNEAPPHPETPPDAARDNTKAAGNDDRTTVKEHARTGSWYSTATSPWRSGASSKAAPLVAQVARESISVAQGVSSSSSEARQSGDVRSDEEGRARRPTQNVSKSFKGTTSRKSIPLVAEATRVHATSNVPSVPKSRKTMGEKSGRGKEAPAREERKEEAVEGERKEVVVEEAPLPPEPELEAMQDVDLKDEGKEADAASVRTTSGTWFGWWSRPDGYGSDTEKKEGGRSATKAALDGAAGEEATDTPLPGSPEEEPTKNLAQPNGGAAVEEEDPSGKLQPEMSVNAASGRSWFGLWSSKQNQQAVAEEQQRRESEQRDRLEEQPEPDIEVTTDPIDTAEDSKAAENKATPKAKLTDNEEDRPRSTGWAFWSKEPAPSADLTQKQIGELAVADTPSQSHPEAAQFNEQREARKLEEIGVKRSNSLLRLKRGKGSKDLSGEITAAATPESSQFQPTPTTSGRQTPVEVPTKSAEIDSEIPQPVQRGKRSAVQCRPNLVLPTFRSTYPRVFNPGYLDRLTSYIGQTLHISGYEPLQPAQHPLINTAPPKVRKAIAIGVHGFFPAAFLHRFVGQPTGTSIRFANYAAASIKSWCAEHQPEIKGLEVEKVSLEGEGYISSRVDTLWKLLLNWLSHLRTADFIMIACHSQGVPVSIQLIAKLLQLGCLSPNVRIGVCAMAGINLGPFPEYKSRFLAGSASELFEFGDSSSKVSVAYADALDICLRHGVRITYIGSIDDQLVSLESALHTPLTHPYVSRAVFIDGRIHTSNFLTHLVVFATKLRNLGVSDHGLLRELSSPLAGSIVGGEGHSRVYDDLAVYMQAIEFALESTDVLPSPVPPKGRQASADAALGDKRQSLDGDRRAGLAGYPKNMTAANHMRRGSLSSTSLAGVGIAPSIAPYGLPIGSAAPAEKNPFVLPWAVRGMLSEDLVKHDPQLQQEVQELIGEFEAWKPVSKGLKDVRWRLEGVRSML